MEDVTRDPLHTKKDTQMAAGQEPFELVAPVVKTTFSQARAERHL